MKPDDFKALSGDSAVTEYQFNTKSVQRFFCKRCGVQAFGHADIPQAGGEYYSVNVHRLEDADITGVPVKYCDGLHDSWWTEAPAFP